MSTTTDQAAALLQKLYLDSKARALEIPQPTNKTDVYKYGALDSNAQVPSFDPSLTPILTSNALDPSVYYVPARYQPYLYGGYGSEYTNSKSVDMTSGVYGEDASLVYPLGYGYAAYPYSPATSFAPQVGGDGQLCGAQQYQYPPTTSNGTFTSTVPASTQSKLCTNKAANVKTLSLESNNSVSVKDFM